MSDDCKEFIIFAETAVTKVDQKLFPLEYLVSELKRYSRVLESFTPVELGLLSPIVLTSSEFSIALGLKPGPQGSLLEGCGVEESARREIVARIKEAEAKSIASINSGKSIAKKLSAKNMSIEELDEELKDAKVEKITRRTIDLSRGPTIVVDFKSKSLKIGGQLKIPTHLNSEKRINFTQCLVKKNLGGGEFEIATADFHKINDNSMIKNGSIRVLCDETSINYLLLQLAQLFNSCFEFEALLSEQIKNKKINLIITKIESDQIILDSEQNINHIKENLSFDF